MQVLKLMLVERGWLFDVEGLGRAGDCDVGLTFLYFVFGRDLYAVHEIELGKVVILRLDCRGVNGCQVIGFFDDVELAPIWAFKILIRITVGYYYRASLSVDAFEGVGEIDGSLAVPFNHSDIAT